MAFYKKCLAGCGIIMAVLVFYRPLKPNNSSATATLIDANQKILVAGVADNSPQNNSSVVNGLGSNDFALTRMNLDGSLDTTFNPMGATPGQVTTDIAGTDDAIAAIALDAENRIIAAGVTVNPNTSANEIAVIRYNNDGSIRPYF